MDYFNPIRKLGILIEFNWQITIYYFYYSKNLKTIDIMLMEKNMVFKVCVTTKEVKRKV